MTRIAKSLLWTLLTSAAVACGARTGLHVPPPQDAAVEESAAPPADAGPDVFDAAEEDALPPIDASPDHVVTVDCPDAGSTLIYLFTESSELYSFYPPTHAFKKVGDIGCPSTGTPFSMGVDHQGNAYALFTSGELFHLSTADASCTATPYVPGQLGWQTFGMGYAGLPDGGEALYVTEADFSGPSQGLGTVDTQTFQLSFVGAFSSPLPRCELTGTGDGRLFAFCIQQSGSGSVLAQIDPATAEVVAQDTLSVGNFQNAFAFAFWGGDFWIFTASGTTTVTRYDPQTKALDSVATFAPVVVGAGVSACAPQ